MNNELQQYLYKLHLFIEGQEKRIKQLEQTVQSLSKEVTEAKNKPAIKVDKIEYKFDQLKVETLEWTLNIGLNPSDLQNIDDFAIDGKQANVPPFSPTDQMQASLRIEEPILNYLETDLEQIIKEYEQKHETEVDHSYIDFIKDDIKKQLPNRIAFYFNQLPREQRNPEQIQETENTIVNSLKKDIQKGIEFFLNNLTKDAKGKIQP